MTEPCPDCGSTSEFHRRHPVTDREINYDLACGSCRFHSERTEAKRTVYRCTKSVTAAPALPSYPGCLLHEPRRHA